MNPRRPPPREPESYSKARRQSRSFPSKLENLVVSHGKLSGFVEWCVSRGTSWETCQKYSRYLEKPLQPGNKWSVVAYKLYARYSGNKELYGKLAIPKSGVDLSVPSLEEIKRTLKIVCEAEEELCLVYNLLLESGARLVEVARMISSYDPRKDKQQDGFWVYESKMIRGSKSSFYIYHLTVPEKQEISESWVRSWASKHNVINPKYIRKFVATTMASLGIPAEIIDFIQGRTPSSILSKHYLNLYALANKEYKKYREWLTRNIEKTQRYYHYK